MEPDSEKLITERFLSVLHLPDQVEWLEQSGKADLTRSDRWRPRAARKGKELRWQYYQP